MITVIRPKSGLPCDADVRKIQAGATNPRIGLRIWPELIPGSEQG